MSDDSEAEHLDRVRELEGLYQQHAHLVYNLALRITCERDSAVRAARDAFVEEAGHGDGAGLVDAVVAHALAEATDRPAAHGAGDADAERLLAATAVLQRDERAALALTWLAAADPGAVGHLIGTGSTEAAALIDRAREGFASALAIDVAQADDQARAWLWARPPDELWVTIRASRLLAPRRRGRWALAALAAVLLTGAAIAAASLGGGSGPSAAHRPVVAGSSPRPNTSLPYKAPAGGQAQRRYLAADEVEAARGTQRSRSASVRRAALRQANKRLSAQEDKQAARRRQAAYGRYSSYRQRRARELTRERKRKEKRNQRSARRNRGTSSPPQSTPSPSPSPSAPAPPTTAAQPTPAATPEPEQRCVYNADTGTYACPK
jgi:hypothetical protein